MPDRGNITSVLAEIKSNHEFNAFLLDSEEGPLSVTLNRFYLKAKEIWKCFFLFCHLRKSLKENSSGYTAKYVLKIQ